MDVNNILDPSNYDADHQLTPEFLEAYYARKTGFIRSGGFYAYAYGALSVALREDFTVPQLRAISRGLQACRKDQVSDHCACGPEFSPGCPACNQPIDLIPTDKG